MEVALPGAPLCPPPPHPAATTRSSAAHASAFHRDGSALRKMDLDDMALSFGRQPLERARRRAADVDPLAVVYRPVAGAVEAPLPGVDDAALVRADRRDPHVLPVALAPDEEGLPPPQEDLHHAAGVVELGVLVDRHLDDRLRPGAVGANRSRAAVEEMTPHEGEHGARGAADEGPAVEHADERVESGAGAGGGAGKEHG